MFEGRIGHFSRQFEFNNSIGFFFINIDHFFRLKNRTFNRNHRDFNFYIRLQVCDRIYTVFVRKSNFTGYFDFRSHTRSFGNDRKFVIATFLVEGFTFIRTLNKQSHIDTIPYIYLIKVYKVDFRFSGRIFDLDIIMEHHVNDMVLRTR